MLHAPAMMNPKKAEFSSTPESAAHGLSFCTGPHCAFDPQNLAISYPVSTDDALTNPSLPRVAQIRAPKIRCLHKRAAWRPTLVADQRLVYPDCMDHRLQLN